MDKYGNLGDSDRLIMSLRGRKSGPQIAEALGIDMSTLRARIQRLKRRGLIAPVSVSAIRSGAPWISRKCLSCTANFTAPDPPKIRRICDMCRKNPDRVCG